MDGKGETEEITYPHVCFTVDNFDEIFSEVGNATVYIHTPIMTPAHKYEAC